MVASLTTRTPLRFHWSLINGVPSPAGDLEDQDDCCRTSGGDQDGPQREVPGPGRSGELRIRVRVLHCLGDPLSGGDIGGTRNVTQRGIEGEARLSVEVDQRELLRRRPAICLSGRLRTWNHQSVELRSGILEVGARSKGQTVPGADRLPVDRERNGPG